jgi:hypothetical protein
MHDGAGSQWSDAGQLTNETLTNDVFVLQDPKMFRVVQTVYFVTPVIGGMWIMSQVR